MTLVEDVQSLREQIAELEAIVDDLRTRIIIAEVEAIEFKGMRKAAYWVVGVIIAGAIGFGFSVLSFVPHSGVVGFGLSVLDFVTH